MEQKVTSILETVEISTGIRTVLREFDHLIEAPNWLPDGKKLLYNAGGGLWTLLQGKASALERDLPITATTIMCFLPMENSWASARELPETGAPGSM